MTAERTPSREGLVLTVLASLLATTGSALGGSVVALVGIPVAALGVRRTARWILAVGVAVLFAGVVSAALVGGDPAFVLLAMVGAVLTWDVGENAISMANQTRAGASGRAEVVHAAMVGSVTLTISVVGYVVFLFASGGQPGFALSLLVFGTVLVLLALSD